MQGVGRRYPLHPQVLTLFPHLFSPQPGRWTSSKASLLPAATQKPDSLPGECGREVRGGEGGGLEAGTTAGALTLDESSVSQEPGPPWSDGTLAPHW